MEPDREVTVRQLKAEATAILRRVESGDAVVVTRRGRPVAVIAPLPVQGVRPSNSLFRRLQRQIEARSPGLRSASAASERRDFARISRKIARALPYATWQEMDRAMKGDRFGLSRR